MNPINAEVYNTTAVCIRETANSKPKVISHYIFYEEKLSEEQQGRPLRRRINGRWSSALLSIIIGII